MHGAGSSQGIFYTCRSGWSLSFLFSSLTWAQSIGTLFGKFKEKKANVVSALHEALDAFFPIIPIDKVAAMSLVPFDDRNKAL
jgi:hypothetical protein